MKFGLEDRHWQTIQSELIQPLKMLGAEVWIFGSRARGDHKPFSDLDVLYKAKAQEISLATIGKIQEALTTSNLPIKVDIVADNDLVESYRNSAILDRIEV